MGVSKDEAEELETNLCLRLVDEENQVERPIGAGGSASYVESSLRGTRSVFDAGSNGASLGLLQQSLLPRRVRPKSRCGYGWPGSAMVIE